MNITKECCGIDKDVATEEILAFLRHGVRQPVVEDGIASHRHLSISSSVNPDEISMDINDNNMCVRISIDGEITSKTIPLPIKVSESHDDIIQALYDAVNVIVSNEATVQEAAQANADKDEMSPSIECNIKHTLFKK